MMPGGFCDPQIAPGAQPGRPTARSASRRRRRWTRPREKRGELIKVLTHNLFKVQEWLYGTNTSTHRRTTSHRQCTHDGKQASPHCLSTLPPCSARARPQRSLRIMESRAEAARPPAKEPHCFNTPRGPPWISELGGIMVKIETRVKMQINARQLLA